MQVAKGFLLPGGSSWVGQGPGKSAGKEARRVEGGTS